MEPELQSETRRCAIYTRKSIDLGLEDKFKADRPSIIAVNTVWDRTELKMRSIVRLPGFSGLSKHK